MLTLTHIASGYLISQAVLNNINSEGLDSGLLTTLAIVGAIAPDVDGLFGKQMRDHRKTPFHAPLAWITFNLLTGVTRCHFEWSVSVMRNLHTHFVNGISRYRSK